MIRPARPPDEAAIAALHWASWRTHYRAVLPADYLDGQLGADLAAQWRDRFIADPTPDLILVAGEINGFIAGFARQGTLYIENLHVAVSHHGQGIGRRLLSELASRAIAQGLQGAHLEVFDANTPAFGFYHRLGGIITSRQTAPVFGHDAAETRFDWPDLAALL